MILNKNKLSKKDKRVKIMMNDITVEGMNLEDFLDAKDILSLINKAVDIEDLYIYESVKFVNYYEFLRENLSPKKLNILRRYISAGEIYYNLGDLQFGWGNWRKDVKDDKFSLTYVDWDLDPRGRLKSYMRINEQQLINLLNGEIIK